jgi:hypothetical protein
MVEVKDVGSIPMNQLGIGGYTKSGHDPNHPYTQVYGFGHYDHGKVAQFFQIYVNDDDRDHKETPFEISAENYMYVECDQKQMILSAVDVMFSDMVLSTS